MLVIAHGIAGRADLPIPAELFGAGAAAALALSFAALAAGWSRPRLRALPERPLFRLPLAVDIVLGTLGVAAFLLVVWAGLTGSSLEQANLAPTAIYVGFWVGLAFVSLVAGDVFRLISPWRAVGRATGWLLGRLNATEPLAYPERLGRWPAALSLAGFAAVELAWGRGTDPQVLAILALSYATVQLVGMSVYGAEAWSRNGDGFGVYFSFFARLSAVGRRADGTLVLRVPFVSAAGLDVTRGTVATVVVAIAATTFDGAKEGPLFADIAPRLQDLFVDVGLGKGTALEWAFLVGLVGACVLVALVFALGILGMPRPADGSARVTHFVHALLPIAAAYVVAHYFSLLAFQGQALYSLVSDPLGEGSDWFGTAGRGIDYGVVSTTSIWYLQVLALVAGHIAALALAHERALIVYGSARAATRSQVAMLGVMIAFTCLGLWLLSVANA